MRRLLDHLPLRAKLYLGMILPLLALVLTGLAVAIAAEDRQQRAHLYQSTHAAIVAMTNDFHRATLLGDQAAGVEVTERLRLFDQINRLWIVDDEGELAFAYSRPGLLPSVPPSVEEAQGARWLRMPLSAQGNQVGSAMVQLSLGAQQAATARRIRTASLLAAGLLVVGFIAAAYLARVIAAPIRHVSDFVVETARTLDTSARVTVRDRREAGALASSINTLLEEVANARSQLESTNQRIEAQVQQRTRELRASERRIRALATHAPVGIFETDPDGGCLFVNRAWTELCGRQPDDALAELWTHIIHPEDADRIAGEWAAAVKRDGEYGTECRILDANGSIAWVSVGLAALRDESGAPAGYLGTLSDVTDRKRMEEELRFGAFHDRLTGLPNRAQLREQLGAVIAKAQEGAAFRYAALYLDLDRFKWINDTMGHQAGDAFLVTTADRIRQTTAEMVRRHGLTAMAARLGGDEFVVLLDGMAHPEHAAEVATAICDALAEPCVVEGTEVASSASVGVVVGGPQHTKPDEVLRDADAAMYRSKEEGRGGVTAFDESMRTAAAARAMLERELRGAVERGEFVLHYQPIIALDSRRPVGFEALLRWRHPARGLLMPADFLEVAEETGTIVPIGRWALRQACRDGREWHGWMPDLAPCHIGVNISARHVESGTLLTDVREALGETGMCPNALMIEVTESTIMRDLDSCSQVLSEVRETGVRISMDDFGTGYSSLAYLRRLPLDALKIDRSFVTGLTADKRTMAILQAIIELAHNLEMGVVAEGVEMQDELASLLALDCQMGQGYLFARPMPAEEIAGWCVRACAPQISAA